MCPLPVQQRDEVAVSALHGVACETDRRRLRSEALLALKRLILLVEVHDILTGM